MAPVKGGAMVRLGRALQQLGDNPLPVHPTLATRAMVEGFARHLPAPAALALRQLLNPRLSRHPQGLLGPLAGAFNTLLRNTVSPNMVRGGEQINVIPAEVSLGLDGRMVPGFDVDGSVAEVQNLVGNDAAIAVIRHEPGPAAPDMGWFDTLGEIPTETDPGSRTVPIVLPGVTDARFLSRLGIQTYGFTPVRLPGNLDFIKSIHNPDERLPPETLDFGVRAIYTALQRMPAR